MSEARRWLLGVALAATLPHLLVLGNPLLHDAPIAITANEAVQRLPLEQVWARDFWGMEPRAGTPWSGSWRPLVTLTWAAQARTLGNAPWLYHAADLALLGACAALLFALLESLGSGRRFAAAAALLFAWHPAGAEAVAVDTKEKVWRVEVRIPFTALAEKPPKSGDAWKVNFYRHDRKNKAFLASTPTLRGTFHTPERFGWLIFAGGGTR